MWKPTKSWKTWVISIMNNSIYIYIKNLYVPSLCPCKSNGVAHKLSWKSWINSNPRVHTYTHHPSPTHDTVPQKNTKFSHETLIMNSWNHETEWPFIVNIRSHLPLRYYFISHSKGRHRTSDSIKINLNCPINIVLFYKRFTKTTRCPWYAHIYVEVWRKGTFVTECSFTLMC